jgi:hypothetical protein
LDYDLKYKFVIPFSLDSFNAVLNNKKAATQYEANIALSLE